VIDIPIETNMWLSAERLEGTLCDWVARKDAHTDGHPGRAADFACGQQNHSVARVAD